MPDRTSPLADLLPAARLLATAGPISPTGRWAYHAASVAAAGLLPMARPAAVRAALARLVEGDPAALQSRSRTRASASVIGCCQG
jgi:hypothetical protein